MRRNLSTELEEPVLSDTNALHGIVAIVSGEVKVYTDYPFLVCPELLVVNFTFNSERLFCNMATENALIDGALRNWHSNMDRAGGFFRALPDDDLQKEIAPGKNRLIYVWGHLTAINDRMIPLLGFGERRYPELDLIFISQPDGAVPHNFSGEAIGDMWTQLDDFLSSEFSKLTPGEWLERHHGVSLEDFEREPHRNRYAILLGRTTHLAYHYGQAILVKR